MYYRVQCNVGYNLLLTSVYDFSFFALAQAGLEVGRSGRASPLWVRNFEIMSTKDCTRPVTPVVGSNAACLYVPQRELRVNPAG